MNTNRLIKELKKESQLNGFTFEDIGDDHLFTGLETPMKPDAFKISDEEKKEKIAILFSDIRGFTPFSEKLTPYDVVFILNRYFTRMVKSVEDNNGTVDNYIGDGMVAIFGLHDEGNSDLRFFQASSSVSS